MKVINNIVGEGLKICQDDEYFKFSLESVLLPNFVKVNLRDKMILDLCSGNAPIPLLLSLKTNAKIYGVELQKEVFDLGIESIKLNHKEDQITFINRDIKDLKEIFKGDTFDIITVNPPYFKVLGKSKQNNNAVKAVARHESSLTLDELFKISLYLLKDNGKFYMVHRTERLVEILDLLRKYRLEPKELQFIFPYQNKESKLFMIKAVKNGHSGMKVLDSLYIYNKDLSYREEIKEIFKNDN